MTENILIYSIGFLAQVFFSARLIYQWLVSEKEQKVLAPSLFWSLSTMGSILLFTYGYLRHDFAIMLGQLLTYPIYLRNLQIKGVLDQLSRSIIILIYVFPFCFLSLYLINNQLYLEALYNEIGISALVIKFGIMAQVIFFSRFVYQWIYAERYKQSELNLGFWMISIMGALLILIYAILRKDPVLIFAHSFGVFIYARNLLILRKSDA